jgi:hypothetical protein
MPQQLSGTDVDGVSTHIEGSLREHVKLNGCAYGRRVLPRINAVLTRRTARAPDVVVGREGRDCRGADGWQCERRVHTPLPIGA